MTYIEENELALKLGYQILGDNGMSGPRIFRKDNYGIWYTGRKGWVLAELINNHWTNHIFYNTLEEVLTIESKNGL